MNFNINLLIFSIPSFIYIIAGKRRGFPLQEIFKKIGWQGSPLLYYLWGLGILFITGGLGVLAVRGIPAQIFKDNNVHTSAYLGMSLSITSFLVILLQEAIFVALGEEVFFRGLLGGWLVRRLGFKIGNAIQAFAFLLPHLLLLLVNIHLWPLVLVQAVTGWLLGWLRHRSDSILPGWMVHSLANALGAIAILK